MFSQHFGDSRQLAGSSAASFFTLKPETRSALAGITGGALSTVLLHPLDVLKTRQAVFGGSIWQQQTIMKSNWSNLYRGVGANVLVSASSWGVYFASFQCLKKMSGHQDSITFAAFGAGVISNLVTNPLSVVRARMVLSSKAGPVSGGNYTSILQSILHIAKKEGLRGFYKGMVPNLINVSHGTIQFVMYEELKSRRNATKSKKISLCESLACCVVSKLMATLITYPCQNLRARQQAGSELAANVASSLCGVVKNEGIRGLYRGLLPTLVHVTPNVCIVFLAYEFFVGDGKK